MKLLFEEISINFLTPQEFKRSHFICDRPRRFVEYSAAPKTCRRAPIHCHNRNLLETSENICLHCPRLAAALETSQGIKASTSFSPATNLSITEIISFLKQIFLCPIHFDGYRQKHEMLNAIQIPFLSSEV